MRNWTGQTIDGRYEILERIGDGGFASVWRAREIRPGAEVAVKILHREHAEDEAFVKAFFEQANRFAKYRDRAGLSTVLDYGSDEATGAVFIAMSLLGPSLEKRLESESTLGADECRRLAREVAASLGVLHADGVVHQNLNARNILARPGDGRFVLTDFGVGLVGEALERTARTMDLNQTDIWAYTSPEQIKAQNPDEIGPAADYYALGVTLYRVATGRFPFEPRIPQVLMDHVSREPPDPATFAPDIDPHVRALILKCLAKDSDSRPSSLADVEAVLTDPSLRAGGDEPQGAGLGDRRPLWLIATLVLVPLAAAAWFGLRALGGDKGESYAIRSTPAGATYRVYEGEKKRFSEPVRKGTTPSSFLLPPGDYSLDLTLDGFFPYDGLAFSVGPGDTLPRFELDRMNRVNVVTKPPGALVVLRAIGTGETRSADGATPGFYPVRPGRYELEATLDGYDRYRDTVQVAGQDLELEFALPEKKGKDVWIFTLPDGANVAIDGAKVSIPTNCLVNDVPFGFRTFSFTRPGFAPFDTSVAVVPDDEVDTVAVELGVTSNPARTTRSANLSDVHRLLREYSRAIESESIRGLKELIREFPTEEERFWTRYFGAAEKIGATALVLSQDVRDRTAELDVRLFLDYRDTRGAKMESSLEYSIEFEKQAAGWRITRTKPRG